MIDPGIEFEGLRHRRVPANGMDFHVAEAGEGDRLALCLHGFPELWISWRYQMPRLAQMGWRVWAPDLRGYGETGGSDRVSDYAIETLMDDVAGLIDAAAAREVMLIAHDWGGVIAWYFALRRVRNLDRLVVMNLPHPGVLASGGMSLRQLMHSWYVFFFQIPGCAERVLASREAAPIANMFTSMACHPERFPDEILDVYRQAALRPGALQGMVNYYRAYIRGGGRRRQHALGYPIIDVPTLFLWGEQDLALTKETTFGTEDFVESLTLRYLPDASHWVQQDQPEVVNEMLEAWLAGERVPEAPPGPSESTSASA
ncbi:MAG: alpha/beta hydrolase [Myxococcota bacterium]